jgi:hypothetical protein
LLIIHFETKAPFAPCALVAPPDDISWFINNVKVPSPLSKAPRPSGTPTILYGVTPSGFRFTESPAVRIDLMTTPGSVLIKYGACELLGPVVAPRFCAITEKLPPVEITNNRKNAHVFLKANCIYSPSF